MKQSSQNRIRRILNEEKQAEKRRNIWKQQRFPKCWRRILSGSEDSAD